MTMTDPTNDDDAEAQDLLADALSPGDSEDGTDSSEDRDPSSGNREAANYRRRLRDTENERDTLRDRLQAAQRREVEQLAGATLENAADLWQFGATLDEFLDPDSGAVSPESVTGVTETMLQARPYLRRGAATVPVDTDQGQTSRGPSTATWSKVIRGD